MKILLLDDDIDMCELMKETFESFGISDIVVCRSYEEVVALGTHAQGFDAAFLDINLGIGQKTGMDAFNWLQAHGFTNRVVFFTGHARSFPLLVSALDKPNVRLLEKPATIAMIKKALYE